MYPATVDLGMCWGKAAAVRLPLVTTMRCPSVTTMRCPSRAAAGGWAKPLRFACRLGCTQVWVLACVLAERQCCVVCQLHC